MSFPPKQNLDVWKGNSFRRKFRLSQRVDGVTTPIDLSGSMMVFRAVWENEDGTTNHFRKEFNDLPEAEDGYFEIKLTPAETRQFPDGRSTKFEIERWMLGEEITVLCGTLNVAGWANDDADM